MPDSTSIPDSDKIFPQHTSDARFRALVEQAPVAMAIFRGEQYVIEMVNQAHLDIWGRQLKDVLGRPLFEAIPEASGQGYEELLANVMTTGEPFHAHELSAPLLRHGLIELVYFNFVYQPIRELDGTITGVSVVANEITQQVLARQKLEESINQMRTMVESAPFPIGVYIGRQMQIRFANQSIIAIYGKGPDVIGKSYIELLPELAGQQIFEQLLGVYETGIPFASANQRVDIEHDGKLVPYYFNYNFTPLFDANGQVYGVMNTAADVTALEISRQALEASETRYRELSEHLETQVQKRTEELAASNEELSATNKDVVVSNRALEMANTDLIRSNQNLEQFAYIASHDLQEPLRKIQQFGDLLKSRYATGEELIYLERMQKAASRMSLLIKDLLAFSRISTSQVVLQPVSLTQVVNQVLEALSVAIEESGAQIERSALPTVQGDSLQLGQLFQNLISNALKFRRQSATGADLRPEVTIRASQVFKSRLPALLQPAQYAERYHLIEVVDNGIGFEEKYIDRIFQVFQRLHGKNEFAGTGIGLAIVQKVVTNHGGAITASSQPGQGAVFSVYLPA